MKTYNPDKHNQSWNTERLKQYVCLVLIHFALPCKLFPCTVYALLVRVQRRGLGGTRWFMQPCCSSRPAVSASSSWSYNHFVSLAIFQRVLSLYATTSKTNWRTGCTFASVVKGQADIVSGLILHVSWDGIEACLIVLVPERNSGLVSYITVRVKQSCYKDEWGRISQGGGHSSCKFLWSCLLPLQRSPWK